MSTLLHFKEVTARKSHKCDFCNGIISKGEKYYRSTCVDEDLGIYDFLTHEHCNELVGLLDMDEYQEGIDSYEFENCITDFCIDNDLLDRDELRKKSLFEIVDKVYSFLKK